MSLQAHKTGKLIEADDENATSPSSFLKQAGRSRNFANDEKSRVSVGAARSFEIIDNNDSVFATEDEVTPCTPTRRLGSQPRAAVVIEDSPDTPGLLTPNTAVTDTSLSSPSKQDQVNQLRSMLQQKKELLYHLATNKSNQDQMLHRLKKQVIHLQMQINDESYNAGKELIKLYTVEQQHLLKSLFTADFFHETSGITALEGEFIYLNDALLKRFYRLPRGLANFITSSATNCPPSDALDAQDVTTTFHSNNDATATATNFVWVDPVKVGYLKKSIIDSRMSIMRLEKQMSYLKGLCEQVANSLQEDLKDVLESKSVMQREYQHQVKQLDNERQSLHETLALHVDRKERELAALTAEVMAKKDQNKELRDAVSTCQTEKAQLESEMLNQMYVLEGEKEIMEQIYHENLKKKDREIKYLQQSMDDMNAQYRESGLVLSDLHIQRLLTLQDSSATFSFSNEDNRNDGDNSEKIITTGSDSTLDMKSIFQCGSMDMIEVAKSPLFNDSKSWINVHRKLRHVIDLLAILPLFPDQLKLILTKSIDTIHIILEDMAWETNHHDGKEPTLRYFRGAISAILKLCCLDESIHSLGVKVLMHDLKVVREKRRNNMECGLRIKNKAFQDWVTVQHETSKNMNNSVKTKWRSKQRRALCSSSKANKCCDFLPHINAISGSSPSDVWSKAAVLKNNIAVSECSNLKNGEALFCGRMGVTM